MRQISTITNRFAQQVMADIKHEITASLGPALKEIILYGSYARNEQTADSDIDIVVLLDENNGDMTAAREKLSDIKVDLSLKYDVVISIIIKQYHQYQRNRNRVPFYANIQRDGVAIYDG